MRKPNWLSSHSWILACCAALVIPAGASAQTSDDEVVLEEVLSLIHISEPTRPAPLSRMPSSA